MRSADYLRLTLRTLKASRMRSGLTVLGIAIGICAVVLLTTLGEGLRLYVLENFSQFGSRIIAINPGKSQTGGTGGLLASTRPLLVADADSLRSLPYVEYVVPVVQGSGAIEFGRRVRYTDIIGTGSEMADAWRFEVARGRFLPDSRGGYPQPWAVLGHKVKQELFGEQTALGQFIRVGGERYRVVGIMAAKGQMLGFDLDDIVYIPVERALSLFNRTGLMEIDVTYRPGISADAMAQQVSQRLIARHGGEDFSLITQDEMLKSLDRILAVLTLAIGGLGGISLVVGAIGIITIMVTSVQERRAEIGLMRALGATQRQVMWLFLGEATLLALVGGVVGILVSGLALGGLALALPTLPIQLDPFYLLLALLLSALVGLISGVLPARRAARLNPVLALQSE
ncbi:ABC transporter permease [Marinobacterium stanieri]|uniref:Putative ABC transport system permease protein n=1 Tax=Marinobacterium stanieri TaxID=49186 RepID=A0A1N6TW22_9GAMM|nr:ABC transporter permease [Marinobacterium stanieri]SIQ57575.1 putative ABC transport system permease protein [Marinobacterium stanieri]